MATFTRVKITASAVTISAGKLIKSYRLVTQSVPSCRLLIYWMIDEKLSYLNARI